MFRDIVSNLSLSPAASTHLTFYWRRLRRERLTRQLSVGMAALLLILQTAIIVAPPDAADASSPNDIICGGIGTSDPHAALLSLYNNDHDACGHSGYQQLFAAFGITLNDLTNAKPGTVASDNHSIKSIGRVNEFSQDYAFTAGGTTKYYQKPLYLWDNGASNVNYPALIGTNDQGKWFAVLDKCGNITTVDITPPPAQPTPVPNLSAAGSGITAGAAAINTTPAASPPAASTPVTSTPVASTPAPPSAPVQSPETPQITQSKAVVDEPASGIANFNADGATAQAGDTLQYTLVTKNAGSSIKYAVTDDINDILEYATLLNPGGATLTSGVLTWPEVKIQHGTSLTDTFTVEVKSPIPTTPQSTTDPTSFDLKLQNTYGNTVITSLPAPAPKQVEAAAANLPQTGAGTDTLIVLVLVAAIAYFYFRNRQLITEIDILRTDHHGPGGSL